MIWAGLFSGSLKLVNLINLLEDCGHFVVEEIVDLVSVLFPDLAVEGVLGGFGF